ncbi:fibronectin type III domain-containing protein [Methylocucumis oryzae]|uniref:Fibronectin type-III domain-containing protein n=1 Tax=Methylocucumis oryzae TaxID=1632867 RepID=A0A0F3IE60_9GAMM|nr:fibronectin type III domain-containing protein [Methylocucumis oryzae]KJV05075.1 hypothetical protein VZ94_20815 [Methylocucumis oryzae]
MNLTKPTEISNIILFACLLVPITENANAATKLSAYPISGQVSLKWSTTANTANYQLCYANQPIKDMSVCTSYTNGVSILSKANKYTATKLTDGTTYYFKIAALNENGDILSSSKSLAIIPQPLLNDTGILKTQCYQTASNILINCDDTAAKNLSTKQDGMIGSDANGIINSDADGFKGFNFTKIDSAGKELPKTAKVWSCIKDNGTGLVWEVKTADAGLRDKQKSLH